MSEIDQTLPSGLVQLNGVTLLDELSYDLALIIFNYKDFFWSYHFLDHDLAQAREDLTVLVLSQRIVGKCTGMGCTAVLYTTCCSHD